MSFPSPPHYEVAPREDDPQDDDKPPRHRILGSDDQVDQDDAHSDDRHDNDARRSRLQVAVNDGKNAHHLFGLIVLSPRG